MDYFLTSHIYLYQEKTDLRKSIPGLTDIVESEMGLDPYMNDTIFFFINGRHNTIKGLEYDHGRRSLHIEKTPQGTFKWDCYCTGKITKVSSEDFADLLRSWTQGRKSPKSARKNCHGTTIQNSN